MRMRLYKKLLVWLFLHLVLLGASATALVGGILLKGADGLLPTYLFSSNIENAFRTISAHCQYTSVRQWEDILEQYNRDPEISYFIYPLDYPSYPMPNPIVPAKLAAAAARIPRHPFTLCPDPAIVLPTGLDSGEFPLFEEHAEPAELEPNPEMAQVDTQGLDAGIPLTPKVLFMRTLNPTRYWLGRPLFIPDVNNKLHYVLMAASSDSIYGHGLYFDMRLILGVLGAGLVISCLWWWPFVRHITRPLVRMEKVSAKLAADDAEVLAALPANDNLCGVAPERSDEVGRLARSINLMARHLHGALGRQRRFISHIAHELNSPLARVQVGLALMEEQSQGAERQKTRNLLNKVERLSGLTVDILNFLREESEPHPVLFEEINLPEFISELIEFELPPDAEVNLKLPDKLPVYSVKRYLRRAVRTVLRNIPEQALFTGCMEIEAESNDNSVILSFYVKGPGCIFSSAYTPPRPIFPDRPGEAQAEGSNPGLSIVDYCIDICRGSVRFFNQEPSGKIVEMLLPARD